MSQVEAKKIFLFPKTNQITILASSFDRAFTPGKIAAIYFDNQTLRARLVGTGNHENQLSLLLEPAFDWLLTESLVNAMSTGKTVLVRIDPRDD